MKHLFIIALFLLPACNFHTGQDSVTQAESDGLHCENYTGAQAYQCDLLYCMTVFEYSDEGRDGPIMKHCLRIVDSLNESANPMECSAP